MPTVLIADDEENIRRGLQYIIDWEQEGFTVAGDAATGTEALRKILALLPDLVLMDIHMPGMQGLDVIRAAREQGFKGRFIVISGYSEFSYAQTALRYGVTDYLTKPVDEDELQKLAAKIAGEIREESETKARRSRILQDSGIALFHELLRDENAAARYTRQELAGMHMDTDLFRTVIFEPYEKSTGTDAMRVHASDLLDNYMDRDAYLSLSEQGKELVLLRGRPAVEAFAAMSGRLLEGAAMEGSPISTVFIAAGPVVHDLSAVKSAVEQTVRLGEQRFYCEKGVHIVSVEEPREAGGKPENPDVSPEREDTGSVPEKEAEDTTPAPDTDGSLRTAARSKLWRQRLFEAVRDGSSRAAEDALSGMETELLEQEMSADGVRLFFSDLFVQLREEVLKTWPERAPGVDGTGRILEIVRASEFLYEILDYGEQLVRQMAGGAEGGSISDTMGEVLDYIDRNYAVNLRLESLAERFGYNSTYFGKVFTRETGTSFNSYLNSRRMEGAKQMLREGRLHIYEIAERSGYGNVDYFSRKFRQYMGMTPQEYRKNCGPSGSRKEPV